MPGIEPAEKHLVVEVRQLAVKPDLQILRRYRRPFSTKLGARSSTNLRKSWSLLCKITQMCHDQRALALSDFKNLSARESFSPRVGELFLASRQEGWDVESNIN
jgi:hypothetical protein